MKRIISIAFVFLFCISLLGTVAFADDSEKELPDQPKRYYHVSLCSRYNYTRIIGSWVCPNDPQCLLSKRQCMTFECLAETVPPDAQGNTWRRGARQAGWFDCCMRHSRCGQADEDIHEPTYPENILTTSNNFYDICVYARQQNAWDYVWKYYPR